MNEVLREKTHWDDPARAFLTRRSGPRVSRPQYEGPPPPPNRFNIKPGYRWDGVDRGNGFERKLFLKINSNQRLRSEYQSTSLSLTQCGPLRTCSEPPHSNYVTYHPHPSRCIYIRCGAGMTSLALTLPLVSPLVTRVLELSGFSPALQTRDIHTLLAPSTHGDESIYKIKWRNDTSAYIIFQDPSIAKRAYLQLLCAPSPLMREDASDGPGSPCARLLDVPYASVRPCTGAEAASLLNNVMSHTPGARTVSSGSHSRMSWGAPGHGAAASVPSPRHFSGETPGAQRRIPSNALPSKPIGSLDNSGILPRAPGAMDLSPRPPSHSRLPSSGAHPGEPNAMRML